MKAAIVSTLFVSLLALAMFGAVRCTGTDNFQVVAVKSYPERGYYTLTGTRDCVADRIFNIPAVRTFKSGRTESYTITSFSGKVEICK